MQIELGDEIQEVITKEKGIAIGFADYLFSGPQWIMQPNVSRGGKVPDTLMFDAARFQLIKRGKVKPIAGVPNPFQNGDLVRDRLSGLEGVVVAITTYFAGCSACLVEPKLLKDGKTTDTTNFNHLRLELVQRGHIGRNRDAAQPEPKRTGGPEKMLNRAI